VFPASWYPDSTSPTVQRWTAPSCPRCNRELGRLERDLLIRMALCLDPREQASLGLAARVFRSLGLEVEDLNAGEQTTRDKLRQRIRAELLPYDGASAGQIPGLGPPSDEKAEWSIPIPWSGLAIMGEKIARGCEYKYRNRRRLVMPPYAVGVSVREAGALEEPFASAGRIIDFGPGFQARRIFFTEDPDTVWYFITIWNALHLHARIEHQDALAAAQREYRPREGTLPEPGRAMQVSSYLRYLNIPDSQS
jgi:hypothetical protein